MCCQGVGPKILAHLSLLLTVWSGLALGWCWWVVPLTTAPASGLRLLPSGALAALVLPAVAAPLTLLLAHLALAAAFGGPSRPALKSYGLLSLVSVGGYLGAVGWTAAGLADWLVTPAAAPALRDHSDLRDYLRPLAALVAPELLADERDSVRYEVWCVYLAVVVWPVLQLTCALLALSAACSRAKREPRSSLRRSSSVYYEPSASAPPPPAHLHQHQQRERSHHAPLDLNAPWY